MPPRSEDELDPVTLMNQALMNIEEDPQGGFKKLNHLLANPPFPLKHLPIYYFYTVNTIIIILLPMYWLKILILLSNAYLMMTLTILMP